MFLVGLTGAIASGKTTVAKMYKDMGAYHIDADKIGHNLLSQLSIKKKIVSTFGKEVLDEKGDIDRSKLGEIVFSNHENLEKLNSILEKSLTASIREKILELKESGYPGIVILEAALLPKWEIVSIMDYIVLVEAPRWQRQNRLVRQRGMKQEEADKRINAQEEIFKKFYPSKVMVVKNNGDIQELKANAMKVWLDLKKLAKLKSEQ